MPEALSGGRYQVLGKLGEGSQGETLEALDKLAGRLVAVKRFRIRGARGWKDIELAEREARVLARLDHPALPRYLDHFEEDGALHLVTSKVEGTSLADHLRNGSRFDQQDVVQLLRSAARVLDYLHTQSPPVIHRDLKPGNVIVRPDRTFAFVDFGCVRDSLKPEGGSTVVGTFGYMAPEQFQGRALPASDVYSIGATALSMLTGRQPETLPHQGLGIDVERSLRGVASPQLIAVLARTLRPDPDERASRLTPLLATLDDAGLPRGARATASPAPSERAKSPRRRVRRRTSPETHPADHDNPRPSATRWPVEHELREAWEDFERVMFGTPGRAQQRRGTSRRASRSGFPTPLAITCMTHGLALARLLVWVVFATIVPLVLAFITLFAGRPLTRTNQRTAMVRRRIDDQLRRVQERLAGSPRQYPSTRVRVGEPASRVRVDPRARSTPQPVDLGDDASPPPPAARRQAL